MMKLSKDFIIGFLQAECNFSLNKRKTSNSYEFKMQINMQKTKNNLLFLKDIKENYLNDIGRIVIDKEEDKKRNSIHYIIMKHDDINYFIKEFLSNSNPFISDKKEYYKLWMASFKYYKSHTFGRGRRLKTFTYKISNTVSEKMEVNYQEINKLKSHRYTHDELSKYNKSKSYVNINKFL